MITPEMRERIALLQGQGAKVYTSQDDWLNGLMKDTKGHGVIVDYRTQEMDAIWREMFQKLADKAYPSERRITMANGQEVRFAYEAEHLLGLAGENLHILAME